MAFTLGVGQGMGVGWALKARVDPKASPQEGQSDEHPKGYPHELPRPDRAPDLELDSHEGPSRSLKQGPGRGRVSERRLLGFYTRSHPFPHRQIRLVGLGNDNRGCRGP